jgi:hypothetical protein
MKKISFILLFSLISNIGFSQFFVANEWGKDKDTLDKAYDNMCLNTCLFAISYVDHHTCTRHEIKNNKILWSVLSVFYQYDSLYMFMLDFENGKYEKYQIYKFENKYGVESDKPQYFYAKHNGEDIVFYCKNKNYLKNCPNLDYRESFQLTIAKVTSKNEIIDSITYELGYKKKSVDDLLPISEKTFTSITDNKTNITYPCPYKIGKIFYCQGGGLEFKFENYKDTLYNFSIDYMTGEVCQYKFFYHKKSQNENYWLFKNNKNETKVWLENNMVSQRGEKQLNYYYDKNGILINKKDIYSVVFMDNHVAILDVTPGGHPIFESGTIIHGGGVNNTINSIENYWLY